MKVEIADFKFDDLKRINPRRQHDEVQIDLALMSPTHSERAIFSGPSLSRTAWAEVGVPVACFGVARGLGWAILSQEVDGAILAVTKAARALLSEYAKMGIPIYAEGRDASACRWLRILGFKPDQNGRYWYE